jgi:hydrogenase nickel incorporation protein HypA/HybF
MHEGAIVNSLLQIAERSKEEAGLATVSTVRIAVGRLHHIVDEVMQAHFDIMKQNIAGFENASLVTETREIKLKCDNCGKTITIDEPVFSCKACGCLSTRIISGDELHIITIEGS